MQLHAILFVGIGGFLGSIARYVITLALPNHHTSGFPWGTFTVNIIGCLLIGIFLSLSSTQEWFKAHSEIRLLLSIGFCGGFTTFSSYAMDSYQLWQQQPFISILYAATSVLLGIASLIIGYYVTCLFADS